METWIQFLVGRIFDVGFLVVMLVGLVIAFVSTLPSRPRVLLIVALAIKILLSGLGMLVQFRVMSIAQTGQSIESLQWWIGGAGAINGLLGPLALALLIWAVFSQRESKPS